MTTLPGPLVLVMLWARCVHGTYLTLFCYFFFREPNKTNLVTFFQTDLSGYLPQSVVDSFFPRSMAEFYPNLQKAVRKYHH